MFLATKSENTRSPRIRNSVGLPGAQIYSFEPLRDCYEQLAAISRHIPGIHAFHFAIGEKSETMTMHRSSQTLSSSLLKMGTLHKIAFPDTAELTTEEISVKTLAEAVQPLDLKDNLFIKIDVQGYEMQVLRGGPEVIKRAKVLIVETSFYPLYEGQAFFGEIYQTLSNYGFTYMGDFESIKNPANGAALQGNAIFLNQR